MKNDVDYDYDDVIEFCKGEGQTDVISLSKDLNTLCDVMDTCEDSFHTKANNSVISQIYQGFSDIIGSSNENDGLSGLMGESGKIFDTCYSEAMTDKSILENGEPASAASTPSTQSNPTPTPQPSTQDPTPSTQNTPPVNNGNTNIDTSKYSGSLHGRGNTSDAAQETLGVVTTNNTKYSIVADNEYSGAPGTISQSDYNLLIAQVCGESGNTADDMLGVTSTVLNRLETGGGFGNSVSEVFEKGYFPWGRSYLSYVEGGRYYNTDWGQDKIALATQVVNDALNGTRNIGSNVYYYSGNGEYNKFSDNV